MTGKLGWEKDAEEGGRDEGRWRRKEEGTDTEQNLTSENIWMVYVNIGKR